jgi:hypothetical protein
VNLTIEVLLIVSFLLGFSTGRIITPAGIIFPIFLIKFGSISLIKFALLYFSIILGYIMTPVHPCVSLTLKFFNVDLKGYLKAIGPPAIVGLAASLLILFTISF